MNLARTRIVLRPRGIGELLDLACVVVGKHALRLYLWLAALVLLPAYALLLALRYALELDACLVWPAAFVVWSLAQGVFTVAAGRWLFAERLGVREVLGAFSSRAVSFTVASVLRLLLIVMGTLALIVPGMVMASHYLFATEASLLEIAGPARALGRSRDFMRYARGRAFGMWLALSLGLFPVLVFVIHMLCAGLVADVLQLGEPFENLSDEGFSPYTLLGFLLSAPYVATARFLMYIDGRTRSEGWDIQVRFMAIAEEHRADDPPAPRHRSAA